MVTKKVSIYKKANDNVGYKDTYSITDVVDGIRSEKYKTITEELRRLKSQGVEKKNIQKFKSQNFKGVTWSGSFSKREITGLKEHSGLICLDFDNLSNERLNRLCGLLADDQHAMICFVSPSGDGVKAIFKINCSTQEEHYLYFESLEKYCLDNFLEKIDGGGKDVSRLCFLPHDPYIFTNYDSAVYELATKSIEPTNRAGIIAKAPAYESQDDTARIADLVAQLIVNNTDITEPYENWAKVGLSFASLGEAGRDFFHQVSSISSKYDASECDKKFNNFLKKGSGSVGISTFFYFCKEHGVESSVKAVAKPVEQMTPEEVESKSKWKEAYQEIHSMNRDGRPDGKYTSTDVTFVAKQFGKSIDEVEKAFKRIFEKYKDQHGINDKPDIFKVELFLKENYTFLKNEITQKTEYTDLPALGEMKRIDYDTIHRQLQRSGFKYPMDKLKSLLRSDFVPSVDPFKEYFMSLPPWDGVTDHIAHLASYIQCEDQEFWVEMLRKALPRSIACAIGGRENRIVMVLVQEKQNTGKSNFIRFINPFGTKYYTESPLRDNKDTEIRFAENFMYNLEELASLGAIDINKLKAVISKAFVKERKAYAEDEMEQPRRCNFWGSTNKSEFLTDTENTRWLCFRIKEINHNYRNLDTGVAEVDINQVWAQAYALYSSGKFNYQLTPEEAAQRDRVNKEYEQSSNEKDYIMMHYKPGSPLDPHSKFMNLVEIMDELTQFASEKSKHNFNRIAMGRALNQLGFHSVRRILHNKKITGYWVLPTKNTRSYEDPNGFNDDDATNPF